MNSVSTRIEPGESSAPGEEGLVVRPGYVPGLIGWVSGAHGIYYAEAWGSGAPFEIQMAREFSEFVEQFDAQRDLVLSAQVNGRIIGAIAVLGAQPTEDGVQLRFFIVDPAWQGRGAGRRLLTEALAWCREQGHDRVFLWTVDGLPRSRHLYEKMGFRIVERHWDDRYTVSREALKMVLEPRGQA